MSPGNGCSGCRAVTKFAGVWGRKQSLPLVWFFFILMTGVDYSKVYLFYTLMHLFLSYSLSMYILIAHMHELVDSNDWRYWVFKMLHSIYMYGQGQDGGEKMWFFQLGNERVFTCEGEFLLNCSFLCCLIFLKLKKINKCFFKSERLLLCCLFGLDLFPLWSITQTSHSWSEFRRHSVNFEIESMLLCFHCALF